MSDNSVNSEAPSKIEVSRTVQIEFLRAAVAFDGPQVVICKDDAGLLYLGCAIPERIDPFNMRYPIALSKVSPETMNRFLSSAVDLRTACTQDAQGEVVLFDFECLTHTPGDQNNSPRYVGQATGRTFPLQDDMLAESNAFLSDLYDDPDGLADVQSAHGGVVTLESFLQL